MKVRDEAGAQMKYWMAHQRLADAITSLQASMPRRVSNEHHLHRLPDPGVR